MRCQDPTSRLRQRYTGMHYERRDNLRLAIRAAAKLGLPIGMLGGRGLGRHAGSTIPSATKNSAHSSQYQTPAAAPHSSETKIDRIGRPKHAHRNS
jgi:hypothetical protein